jgi:hypothetical protein
MDFSRPTNSGMTICGNTTTSRNGSNGIDARDPVGDFIEGLLAQQRASGHCPGNVGAMAGFYKMGGGASFAPAHSAGAAFDCTDW